MTRLVTWINNSTDYLGTEIFRGETLDPESLPEPVATVGPVAQGVRVEWPDRDGDGDLCYLVRDFDAEGVGEVSEGYCFEADTDWSSVSIGDEVEGGIYAGKITYADAREFHIVAAKAAGEVHGLQWKKSNTSTAGTDDFDDGLANTQAMESAGITDHPAGEHCVNYSSQGFEDWYLPAKNEMILIMDNLVEAGHPEFSDNSQSIWRWLSREESSLNSGLARWDTLQAFDNGGEKESTSFNTRPIRRVPV